MRWLASVLLILAVASPARAAETDSGDALAWLQKISTATHQLNYTGTFVYQNGSRIETARITHMVDAEGEHEKLVTLDGAPREMYRVNNDVLCLLPDSQTAVVDKSRAKKIFPAILPAQISSLRESYDVKLGGRGRVAGRDAQIVLLEPRDQYRYRHKLWADAKTGLLLRAGVWNDHSEMVDRFSFSHVSIGGPIDKAEVRMNLAGRKLITSTDEDSIDSSVDPGWQISSPPPGFKKISALKRMLPGGTVPVNHIVFSDGLAAVSVFIAPMTEKTQTGLSHRGALHVYTRTVAEHEVKVLGEVPSLTVRQLGDSVVYVNP
jgi:sigma-E factor negative regulatory protein RseB